MKRKVVQSLATIVTIITLSSCGDSGTTSKSNFTKAVIEQNHTKSPTPAKEIKDTIPPTLTLFGEKNTTLEFGKKYQEAGFEAIDNVDGNITNKVTIQNNLNSNKLGEYTITYSVTDSSRNEAKAIRTIKVVDTTPPTIILKGDKTISLELQEHYIELGAEAIDNVDGNISSKIKIIGKVDTSKAGKYTITYSVTDSSGNEANITREVIINDPYAYIPKEIDDYIAVRFLNKATFGATTDSIAQLKEKGIIKWLDEQLNMPLEDKQLHLRTTIEISKKIEPSVFPKSVEEYLEDNDIVFNKVASFRMRKNQNSAWFSVSLFQKDQLREKVSYALSQIIVESLAEPIFTRRTEALSRYFDILRNNALGNYRDLLLDISFSSSMSLYLTFNGNKKEHTVGDSIVYPDENYAREIMQLFTIGLKKLNIDGSAIVDANGNTIPTYTQKDITEIAKVFTGWDIKRNSTYGRIAFRQGDLTHPCEFTEKYHDFGEKKVLGQTIPAGLSGEDDIKALVDILMNHQNTAPFISKILIQRLTKSNPSPEYIQRVATVFRDNGQGVTGDLKAVVKAIFLDEEFWSDINNKNHIKFKEPLVALTQFFRAFNAQPFPKFRIKGKNYDVENVFFLNEPSAIGQAPGRAFSVFNFYDKDFIPNDSYFKENNLVAPELQIQTEDAVIRMNNYLFDKLRLFEKKVVGDGGGNIKRNRILLDTSEEDAIIELALEGSVDGNISNLADRSYQEEKDANGGKEPKRALALKALIEHLDKKLTGKQLSKEFKDELFNKHIETFYSSSVENKKESTSKAIYTSITMPLIVAIMTSNVNMTE